MAILLFAGVLLMVYNVIALLRAPKGHTEYPMDDVFDLSYAAGFGALEIFLKGRLT